MANRIQVSESITILELFRNGWAKLRIARELGIDVKTVRRCILEAAAADSKSLFPHLRDAGQEIQKGQFRTSGIYWGKHKIPVLSLIQNPYFRPPGKMGASANVKRTGNGSRMPWKTASRRNASTRT